jgi:hypothetical protein
MRKRSISVSEEASRRKLAAALARYRGRITLCKAGGEQAPAIEAARHCQAMAMAWSFSDTRHDHPTVLDGT